MSLTYSRIGSCSAWTCSNPRSIHPARRPSCFSANPLFSRPSSVGSTRGLLPRPRPCAGREDLGWPPTPLTILGGLRLELLSGKGLEPALLEGIGLKDETVFCHHGVVPRKTPMQTRTVPWLHSVRLPRRGHQRNGHNAAPSVPSRSPVRCVSLSLRKSGNKSNTPPSSTVAATGHAGRCNPSS